MDIAYNSKKMSKIFNSERTLIREYGTERARKIRMRRNFLRAAVNLAQVPVSPPTRRHELKGDRKGQFAVDLTGNYRLVFEPNCDPVPKERTGDSLWQASGQLPFYRSRIITMISQSRNECKPDYDPSGRDLRRNVGRVGHEEEGFRGKLRSIGQICQPYNQRKGSDNT